MKNVNKSSKLFRHGSNHSIRYQVIASQHQRSKRLLHNSVPLWINMWNRTENQSYYNTGIKSKQQRSYLVKSCERLIPFSNGLGLGTEKCVYEVSTTNIRRNATCNGWGASGLLQKIPNALCAKSLFLMLQVNSGWRRWELGKTRRP